VLKFFTGPRATPKPPRSSDGPKPPVPLPALPPQMQPYARYIDDTFGNKDGVLDTPELDAFAAAYGNLPEHQDPISMLRRILDPVGSTSGIGGTSSADSLMLARKLCKTGGSAIQDDLDALIADVARVPAPVLRMVERAGIRFVACQGSVTDHLRQLRGQAPRGWPPGVTWDTVPGLYWPNEKQVVVATRADHLGNRTIPPTGAGHGSYSIVAHEMMHALDYQRALGDAHAKKREFVDAWKADRATLPDYLKQNEPAGPEESFAEIGSRLFLGDRSMAGVAPNLTRYFDEVRRNLGIS
jgi:hypothetical protein